MSKITPIVTDFGGNSPWTPTGITEWERKRGNGIYFPEKVFPLEGPCDGTALRLFHEPQGFACHFHVKPAVLQLNFNCRLPAPKSV